MLGVGVSACETVPCWQRPCKHVPWYRRVAAVGVRSDVADERLIEVPRAGLWYRPEEWHAEVLASPYVYQVTVGGHRGVRIGRVQDSEGSQQDEEAPTDLRHLGITHGLRGDRMRGGRTVSC